ncbi:hypothetical protein SKAU_G00257060 [Synaphobranchus kaupii]|uniref:Uncharacterized protein n=1 Tax=Synaphobranchus kaupii TaxID=118154 RepID=A0A9Q1F463_SYNKA|nr:hypothetical protein SKAU_G00257060 [Synaphobranchus kaupii]
MSSISRLTDIIKMRRCHDASARRRAPSSGPAALYTRRISEREGARSLARRRDKETRFPSIALEACFRVGLKGAGGHGKGKCLSVTFSETDNGGPAERARGKERKRRGAKMGCPLSQRSRVTHPPCASRHRAYACYQTAKTLHMVHNLLSAIISSASGVTFGYHRS